MRTTMTRLRATIGLGAWLVLCFGAAAVGSVFTAGSVGTWYSLLRKPSWTPPNSAFGPAWTILYAMMAIAAWRVWMMGGFSAQRRPLVLFLVQLAANVGWSVVFFGARMPGLGFAWIVILWALILATTVAFWRRSALAGWLMVPYLLWVGFASALNLSVWLLNR
jgi:tryptophan-rich sensory protein